MSTPNNAARSAETVRVPLSTKWMYAVGEMPITISMALFGLFVMFFYGSVMHLPPALVGVGTALGLFFDAVIDPYIGYRSDVSTNRFGHRHSFMLMGCVSMGVSFSLLMSPPQDLDTPALFAWLLATTLLFRFTSALYRVPYLSLGAELSSDYDERTVIVGIRSLVGLCGTLAAASLSFALFFPNTVSGVDPKLAYSAYPKMGVVFGALMSLTAAVAIAGTLRTRARRSPMAAASMHTREFFRAFKSSLDNDAFRHVWLTFTLSFFALVVNAAVAIHFFTWYVRIFDSAVLSRIQLCFYVGALAGVPLWLWLARYLEKWLACLIAISGTASLLILATLLIGEGHVFGTANPLPLFVGNSVAGLFAAGLWIIPASMLADVTDLDHLECGRPRGGLFFGMLNFGEKLAAASSLLVGGVLLQFYVGLRAGEDPSPLAVARIGMLYGVFPALALLLGALPLFRYTLTRDAVRLIQSQLVTDDDSDVVIETRTVLIAPDARWAPNVVEERQ